MFTLIGIFALVVAAVVTVGRVLRTSRSAPQARRATTVR